MTGIQGSEGMLVHRNVDSSSKKELTKRTSISQSKYMFLYFGYLFKFQALHLEHAEQATKVAFSEGVFT